MIRLLTAVVVGSFAFVSVASASSAERVTYLAELRPVDDLATLPFGGARLVDAKTNNYVTVDVEGLQPAIQYPWHVHIVAAGVTDPCAQGAAQGPIVSAFRYEALAAGNQGTAKATGKSTMFDGGTYGYYVNIHDPQSGSPVACGVLALV
jgi:hypothetical protein